VAPPLDLLVELLELLEVKTMNRRLQLLDLLVPASLIVLLVSFALLCMSFWTSIFRYFCIAFLSLYRLLFLQK